MTTIKNYTDISQSKKLAEILPIESADMYYSNVPVRELVDKNDTHVVFKSQIFAIENLCNHKIGEGDIYAWSLAALLSVLPDEITYIGGFVDNWHWNYISENVPYSDEYLFNLYLMCKNSKE